MNDTITVRDWRGKELEINEEDYVKKWVDHTSQFCHICTPDEKAELEAMVERMARKRFRVDLALEYS